MAVELKMAQSFGLRTEAFLRAHPARDMACCVPFGSCYRSHQICLSSAQELEPQLDASYFSLAKFGLDDGLQFNSYLARNPVPYQVQNQSIEE